MDTIVLMRPVVVGRDVASFVAEAKESHFERATERYI
jgi:hypothetical protein